MLTRSIGLYVISLSGAERSFSYWRDSSAARRLADDPDELAAGISGGGLIHISGITLAIIGEVGRRNLLKALDAARSREALFLMTQMFDPVCGGMQPRCSIASRSPGGH